MTENTNIASVSVTHAEASPVQIDTVASQSFDQESAAAYVREYLAARRSAKPSLRRLVEAVAVLFAPDKHNVSEVARTAQITTSQGLLVLTRIRRIGRMIPEGLRLLELAEAAGKRISVDWAYETAICMSAMQLTMVRSKARSLGIKL